MKKENFIFLSNSTGGIKTFEENLVEFFANKEIPSIIVNKKNIQQKKCVKFYKCNILREFFKFIKILIILKKKTINKKNIFIISNPTIFAIYFLFINIIFKRPRIIFFFHSHLIKINFLQVLSGIFSSFFSIFIYKTIFVSNFTKNWWNLYFPFTRLSNNFVQYNKIPKPKKNFKKDYKKIKIGFVGRLNNEKGLKEFLYISKILNSKNIKFYIFGDGPIKINRKKFNNINIFKWTKKETIYRKINILMVTSKTENCPLNVLEAKSYGIPTITISDGGIKEIIKNNRDGIILKKNIKRKKLVESINMIFNNYKKFEKNCVEESKKFYLENYKKRFFI